MTEQNSRASRHSFTAQCAAGVLLIGGFVACFAHNFWEMWHRWFPAWRRSGLGLYDRLVEGESYYTHGPLVPLVSLVMAVLLIRHTRIAVRPRQKWGLVILVCSLLVHLVSTMARVNFLSCFALIGVLAGLVVLLWGFAAFRRLWFPILFLIFMAPVPEVTIAQWNFRLKILTADWGVWCVNFFGIIADQAGSRVFLEGDKSIIVANVCNGLRTIISLLAFGAIYVYVCRLRGVWRWVLFAMVIPVALICNTIRIVALLLVAHFVSVEKAAGAFHDISGAFIFIMALLLMFGLEKLIIAVLKWTGHPLEPQPLLSEVRLRDGEPNGWPAMRDALANRMGWVAILLLAVTAVEVAVLNRNVPVTLPSTALEELMPAQIVFENREMDSYAVELDEKTLTILEYPNYFSRRYMAPGMPTVDVSVLFSQDNRKGIHPPELCLEGSGEGIIAKTELTVDDVPGRGEVPAQAVLLRTGKERMVVVYTYRCAGRYTRSFWKQQFLIFFNGLLGRSADGALIQVSTPVEEKKWSEAETRAKDMFRLVVTQLDKKLP